MRYAHVKYFSISYHINRLPTKILSRVNMRSNLRPLIKMKRRIFWTIAQFLKRKSLHFYFLQNSVDAQDLQTLNTNDINPHFKERCLLI